MQFQDEDSFGVAILFGKSRRIMAALAKLRQKNHMIHQKRKVMGYVTTSKETWAKLPEIYLVCSTYRVLEILKF